MFEALAALPVVPLAPGATPIEELSRLRAVLGGGPRLLVKRDDAIGFAFGGNKVRKMRLVAADALRRGADTLVTSGGVQSNHARVTAAAAARLGMNCVLVVNGAAPPRLTANALLDQLLGAQIRYVERREERAPAVEQAADELRRAGKRPYVVPIGASTPLGAAAYVLAVRELLEQIDPPTFIIHASSSGGTQAGLAAGCALAGVRTRVRGVSADDKAAALELTVRQIMAGLPALAAEAEEPRGAATHQLWEAEAFARSGVSPRAAAEQRLRAAHVEVDDGFVGEGYGKATAASQEALELTARTESIFLDPTYTAKAMAALIASVRRGEFQPTDTVLFWHTGGQVALFA